MTTHLFPRTRLLPIAFALLTFGSAAHATLPQLNGQAPIVIAHRGASGYLPEHTLGGYELAVKLGADYIEPDLQLTKDGTLIAMHDATLTRTTNVATLFATRNGTYNVADFTLAEIKTLTVKPVGSAGTTYPGFTPISADPYRVPTFDAVIDLARGLGASTGREIGIYPEAKQADPAMEDKILATLVAKGYTGTDKVFIQSFSADTISSLHAKQALLGVDFNLLVLSSSSNALVTYGLDKIKSFADGIGVSITGRRHERVVHRSGTRCRLAGAWLHLQQDRQRRRRRIRQVLRLGHGRRVLELHRLGAHRARRVRRGTDPGAGHLGLAAGRRGRGRFGCAPPQGLIPRGRSFEKTSTIIALPARSSDELRGDRQLPAEAERA